MSGTNINLKTGSLSMPLLGAFCRYALRRRICHSGILLVLFMTLANAVQAQFNYTISANLTITITGYTGGGRSVSIPNMINGLPVTSIADSAFAGSSVTNITIPNSVTNFGPATFGGCDSLMAINVDPNNNGYYSSAGGVLFDKIQSTLILCPHARAGAYTIPTGVTTIATGAFTNSVLNSVILPSTLTTIGDYACQWCTNLRGITIPDSVINIGGNAFYYCTSLTNVTIGNSVTNIGNSAFNNCTSLTNVTIGNSVTSIGNSAFQNCSRLTNVTLGNRVINIPDSAFQYCSSLTSVTIPNQVINIGAFAFEYCISLTNVTIGNNVTNIANYAFDHTALNTVTIPDSVINIGTYAFAYCANLTNVTTGNSVINIGTYAFVFCTKLSTVTISGGIIGATAFTDCTNLTTVTLGKNVTTIGDEAFTLCPALAGVYFLGNAPDVGISPFGGSDRSIIYYLPQAIGWGTSLAGRPALPINLQIAVNDSSFGVRTNQFGFNITGSYGLAFVVESATDLANPTWSPLLTNTLTGSSFYFSDPKWTNYPSRFYRVRWP